MRRGFHLGTALLLGPALLLLLPGEASAWGPGTHVHLGLEILRSLDLLPASVASLLIQRPLDFLYGSLAADISMAKKYAPVGRHCHHWHVAWEIHAAAGDDPALKAATTGYLCHLASDVLAHNSFVPRMLVLTSSTRALGHSYWEQRMDAHLGSEGLAMARRIVTGFDHSRADALFDRVLSATLFSFRTNRRIFRGLIRIQDYQRWQAIFDTVIDHSRWELDPVESEVYVRHAFEDIAGFLRQGRDSRAAAKDPTGEDALVEAKRIRREALRHEGWRAGRALQETADAHFPLPNGPTSLWERRGSTVDEAEEALRTLLPAPAG